MTSSSAPASLLGSRSEAATPLHVVQVRPAGYVHAEALTELAECVYFGLRRLGIRAFYREAPDRAARQIVLGAHLLDAAGVAALPSDAIIYNSEQIDADSGWLRHPYLAALQSHPVWDYSAENVRRLAALGIESVRHVPLGYVPELARIAPAGEEIDVLFYGSVNERRQQVLEGLKARGLKVVALFGAYGEERDRAIAHAKVLLSVHYYEAKIFEIVRAAYLFTNEKALVAECGPDTAVDPELREAMCGVPYSQLIDSCVELVRDASRRAALAKRGHSIFARHREEDILAAALDLAEPAAPGPRLARPVLPSILQLGSGKDFRTDCLNIDINAAWGPDAVCDIACGTLIGSSLDTVRFGAVTLTEGLFDGALANDVLEHIPDLTTAMTNVLRLLKPGGVFEVFVPYDLSLGAWQDPTHVRAFNERSWLYYTDWHWYLGWTDARFDAISLDLQMTPLGVEMQRAGRSMDEILRTPRAVDAMRVRLRKRFLQESERREALRRQPGPRA